MENDLRARLRNLRYSLRKDILYIYICLSFYLKINQLIVKLLGLVADIII